MMFKYNSFRPAVYMRLLKHPNYYEKKLLFFSKYKNGQKKQILKVKKTKKVISTKAKDYSR